jgi:hypothetical protein
MPPIICGTIRFAACRRSEHSATGETREEEYGDQTAQPELLPELNDAMKLVDVDAAFLQHRLGAVTIS